MTDTQARPALLGRLRIRGKLYLAFSAISGLVIALAIVAAIWTSHSDAEIQRARLLAEFAERQLTVVELKLMTMSDAMRGYLLDPANQAEVGRKLAADNELNNVVDELTVALVELPSVLQLVTELETYDDQILNKAEDHLVEMTDEDIAAAKLLYKTDYLPKREREIELILALRHEVAQVQEALRAKAAQAFAKQLALGLSGTAMMLILSWLIAWLSARVIGDRIQGMTTAMGKLADGDTTIEIPAQDGSDEIGDMARAVEVFRTNAIARRQGELALQRINLEFDAALNSMLHGMVVWSLDHRVQLVNRRFLAICGMPPGSIGPGMTVREVVDNSVRHGLHPDQDPEEICRKITALLAARRSVQFEMPMRPDLLARIASEPMENGGTVVTFEDVTEKRQNEDKIVFMAGHDALTGLSNRTMFQEYMEAAVARSRAGQPFAALCLDLDHFKEVNDTLGHPAGDELLRQVVGRRAIRITGP
jgi:PAS domain-containing protein